MSTQSPLDIQAERTFFYNMAAPLLKVLLSLSAVLVLLAASNVRAYSIQQEQQRINSVINSPRFFPQRHRRAPADVDPLQRLDGRHMFTGSYSGNYAIGKGPSYAPNFAPKVKYTTNGRKYSVFAPPIGDFFPYGERFYWPVDE